MRNSCECSNIEKKGDIFCGENKVSLVRVQIENRIVKGRAEEEMGEGLLCG